MAHAVHRFSAVARPVEPKYPTNLAILVIMAVALVGLAVAALVRGAGVADAVLGGLVGALVVFTTWALARDLAPDDNPGAFVALVPAAAAVLLGANPMLMGPLTALILARVVNRSVGPPATVLDRVGAVTLVFLMARDGHGLGVGVAAVLAFGLDAMLPERQPKGWLWALLAAVAAGLGIALGGLESALVSPGPWTYAAMATAGLFSLVIITQPPPRSPCDAPPHAPLRRDRVQGGMVVALLVLLPSLAGGDAAVQAWIVGWAACLGVALTRPLSLRSGASSGSS
ncbi:MAG: hypothetical protein AB1Z98_36625 [Nannocystaceae bacterium]